MKANKREYISIKVEDYKNMLFRYFKAIDQICDLELEIFELQEELSTKHKKANTK